MNWMWSANTEGLTVHLGDGGRWYSDPNTTIYGAVRIGRNSIVHSSAYLVGTATISCGRYCVFGSGFHCHTHEDTTDFVFPKDFYLDLESKSSSSNLDSTVASLHARVQERAVAPMNPMVAIGNAVVFKDEVTVLQGVTIGDGCLILSESVVESDCEPYGIYAGAPARRISERFAPEVQLELTQAALWNLEPYDLPSPLPFSVSVEAQLS